jgi:hypothetical protein
MRTCAWLALPGSLARGCSLFLARRCYPLRALADGLPWGAALCAA